MAGGQSRSWSRPSERSRLKQRRTGLIRRPGQPTRALMLSDRAGPVAPGSTAWMALRSGVPRPSQTHCLTEQFCHRIMKQNFQRNSRCPEPFANERLRKPPRHTPAVQLWGMAAFPARVRTWRSSVPRCVQPDCGCNALHRAAPPRWISRARSCRCRDG